MMSSVTALLLGLIGLALGQDDGDAERVDLNVDLDKVYNEVRAAWSVGDFAEVRARVDVGLGHSSPSDYRSLLATMAARAAIAQRDSQAAHDYLDEALAYTSLSAVYRIEANGLRGDLWLSDGRVDLAAPLIEEAYDVAEQLWRDTGASAPTVRNVHLLRVRLEMARGDHRAAERLIEAMLAVESLYAPGRPRGTLLVNLGIARDQLEWADPARPKRSHEAFLAALESFGDDPCAERAACDLALARAATDAGRLEEAATWIESARETIAAVWPDGARLPISVARPLTTESARLAVDYGPWHDRRASCADDLERVVDRVLAQWDAAPQLKSGLSFLHYRERREPVGELIRLWLALHGDPAGAKMALRLLSDVQARGTLSAEFESGSIEDIQRLLCTPSRGLLVYLPVARRSHVLAVSDVDIIPADLPGFHELARRRTRYLGSLLTNVGDAGDRVRETVAQERSAAAELSAALLPPAIARVAASWSEWTIVGLDVLGDVPLEWLPLLDEPYLGARHAISHLPSIPFGAGHARQGRAMHDPARLELALFGGTLVSAVVRARFPDLVDLPLNETAERVLTRTYDRVTVARGEDATPAALLEIARSGCEVLQILAHGIQDPDREPPGAALLTADRRNPDGVLDDATIRGAEVKVGLVMLSSCRSGEGPERRGDPGSADPGGAWLTAGAEAALVNLSDIRFGDTIEWTALLHHRIRALGHSPAEALRDARAAALREHGDLAPFRVAWWRVVGDGHRPRFDAPIATESRVSIVTRAVAIAAIALVAVTLFAIVNRRRRRRTTEAAEEAA